MLALTRKTNEEIVIDGNIVVTVISINGDRVRLGITAPHDVPVHRKEIYEKLEKQQEGDAK